MARGPETQRVSVTLPGSPREVAISWDKGSQHTLSWSVPLKAEDHGITTVGSHTLPYFPAYNSFTTALHELTELALLGESSTYYLQGSLPQDSHQLISILKRGLAGEEIAEYPEMAPQV